MASCKVVNLNLAISSSKNSAAAKIAARILNLSSYGDGAYLKKCKAINNTSNAQRINFFKKRSYSKLRYFLNQKIRRTTQLKSRDWNFGSNYDKPKKFTATSYIKIIDSQVMLLLNLPSTKFDNISSNLVSSVIKSSLRQNSLMKIRNDIFKSTQLSKFRPKLSDYLDKSLVDFLTFTAGSKAIIQFYPFLANSNISQQRISFYKN